MMGARADPIWLSAHSTRCDMNGVTETMMLARGFTLAMLGVLVRKRLVIVQWKPVRVGGEMIEVGRFRITDTGRQALEGGSSRSSRPSEAQ